MKLSGCEFTNAEAACGEGTAFGDRVALAP